LLHVSTFCITIMEYHICTSLSYTSFQIAAVENTIS